MSHMLSVSDGFHGSTHDTARDAERWLIRRIVLHNLLTSRHGGAGRVPNDTSIGAVFIIVCTEACLVS